MSESNEGLKAINAPLPKPEDNIQPRMKTYPARVLQGIGEAKTRTQQVHEVRIEAEMGEEDWREVYKAYAKVGKRSAIMALTGLPSAKVHHLLHHGLARLGLPAIKDHATNTAEVNLRSHEAMQEISANSNLNEDNFLLNLPEYQAAITNRAAREAAAAASLLEVGLRGGETFLGFMRMLTKKMQREGEAAFDEPDKITPKLLETLSKAMNSLSNTIDTAIQVSRRAAGEPERNLSLEVSYLVGLMDLTELREYKATGKFPRRIMTGASGSALGLLMESDPLQRPIEAEFTHDDTHEPVPLGDTRGRSGSSSD